MNLDYHVQMARAYGDITVALWQLARLVPEQKDKLNEEAREMRQLCVHHCHRARAELAEKYGPKHCP